MAVMVKQGSREARVSILSCKKMCIGEFRKSESHS